MGKIHELSEELTNKIAAGEVIERPASVVKEVVENAIDAGATRIEINIIQAGMKKITVTDNGSGIDPEDIDLAFKRNSTSKINSANDLFNINSLGFRGEALASIASIARVTLITSVDGKTGVEVKYENGKQVSKQTVAHPKGTTIEVEDLFYNTPARLKHIKSQNTEMNKIIDIVDRIAMGNSDVQIKLKKDNKIIISTSGKNNLLQTISGIYGTNVAKKMVKINGEDADFAIEGYTSLPEETRSSRNYISIILNDRYIKNYALTKAVIAGYGTKLMVGRYPITVINVKTDPHLVDVNVHPTKSEVRLSKEDQLSNLISQSIASALQQETLIPDAMENLTKERVNKVQINTIQSELDFNTKPDINNNTQIADDSASEVVYEVNVDTNNIFENPEHLHSWDERMKSEIESTTPIESGNDDSAQVNNFPQLRYVGQVHGTYLIAENPEGMYIVDQHAAQERINYEKYSKMINEADNKDQQNLLVPIVLEYSNADVELINDRRDVLESLGIYLESFGQNSFMINQHPTWFIKGQEEDTIREMIDFVLTDKNITVDKFKEATIIMMSCKRAIKANHHLSDLEAQSLLTNLQTAKNPYNCPHGRPVLVKFTNTDLEKMFKRIQDSHKSWGE